MAKDLKNIIRWNKEPIIIKCEGITARIWDKDIDDIMDAALAGGIFYWCEAVEVDGEYLGEYASEQISRGGTLILYDSEENKTYTLNKEKFIEGMKKYIESYGVFINRGMNINTCDIDSEAADCIIQYALFGDVIFG